MAKHYTKDYLRMLRNKIPIDAVIVDLLNLEVLNSHKMLRFRCPLCHGFHTAIMAVGKCGFKDAVEILKNRINP